MTEKELEQPFDFEADAKKRRSTERVRQDYFCR